MITLEDLHINSEVYLVQGGRVTPCYVRTIEINASNYDCPDKRYKVTFVRRPVTAATHVVMKGDIDSGYGNREDEVLDIPRDNNKFYLNVEGAREAQRAFRQKMYDQTLKEIQIKASLLAKYQEDLNSPCFGEEQIFDSDKIPEAVQKEFAESIK